MNSEHQRPSNEVDDTATLPQPLRRRAIAPSHGGWVRLLTLPTGYLFALALVATIAAKLPVVWAILDSESLLNIVGSWAADVAVYFGLAAVALWAEDQWTHAKLLTRPTACLCAIIALASCAYLTVAGEQASWGAFIDLIIRFQDLLMVLDETLSPSKLAILAAVFSALAWLPWLWQKTEQARSHAQWDKDRFRLAPEVLNTAIVSILFLAILAVTPEPSTLEGRALRRNAIVNIVRSYVASVGTQVFHRSIVGVIPRIEAIERLEVPSAGPNVVVVILESTRFDHTSLAGKDAMADTPAIANLAKRGTIATKMRALLPHTTKSMFSMFCGRMPFMQRDVLEISKEVHVRCLAQMLGDAGYRTKFFQGAFGTFEQRPRLIEKLGFQEFVAWEDIGGRRLGYFSSADSSLVKPFDRWLETLGASNQPFFATILSSAAHHPYRVPDKVLKRARRKELPDESDQERYRILVQESDRNIKRIVRRLNKRGLLDNTIIIVVGDHGEGFGDRGVRQHDNNFFEEGLRVPFVMAGPGVPTGLRVDRSLSLLDTLPTILGRLGVDIHEGLGFEGEDFLADPEQKTSPPKWFSCYSRGRCRGVVLDDVKLVYRPMMADWFMFDLAVDPREKRPVRVSEGYEALMEQVQSVIPSRQVEKRSVDFPDNRIYPPWVCHAGDELCLHPKAKKKKHRLTQPVGGQDIQAAFWHNVRAWALC